MEQSRFPDRHVLLSPGAPANYTSQNRSSVWSATATSRMDQRQNMMSGTGPLFSALVLPSAQPVASSFGPLVVNWLPVVCDC